VIDLSDAKNNIDELVELCHEKARANHWWDKERNFGELIALIHSEVSEAMEGYRTDKLDEHIQHHQSVTVELADALVRIFDLAGGFNLPLGLAFAEKLKYNQDRADHKLAARNAPGGKKF
jgi:NTP pyrophosphatase (non-canonical NTP hydrolase)